MKLYETDIRICSSISTRLPVHTVLLILLFLFCIELMQPAGAQQPDMSVPTANAPLSIEQIVENLIRMNLERAHALHAYNGTRIYRVDYRGLPGTRSAEMVVNVEYQSPGTKEFTIQSAIGSKVIIDKVFKKLLEAEKEASAAEVQRRTALNYDNYDFILVGLDHTPYGSMYVLIVEPKKKDKFLYRGRIWVDPDDFAVVRLEAEPAKNPSFWIKGNEIEQVYMKVNDFWLPSHNRSVTTIRLGGRAELTIQYNNYQITGSDPVVNLTTLEPTQMADISRGQRSGNHP